MITALFALLVVGTLGQPGYEEDYGEWGEEPEPVGEPDGDYGDPAVSVDYGDRYYVSPGGEYYEQQRAFGGLARMEMRDFEEIFSEGYQGWIWSDEAEEMFTNLLEREICDLKADNCTSYNSFFLDCHCVEQFEMVKPQCKSFKCDLLNWLHANGPTIVKRLFESENIRQMVDVIAETLPSALEQINFCECGKDTARALVNCARFYNGHVLKSTFDCNERDRTIDIVQRMMDHKNTKKLLNGIVDGVCEEVKNGNRCYHNLLEALKNIATMVDTTMQSFEAYSQSAEKRTFLQQCDNFFKPIDVFSKSRFQADLEYGYGEPSIGLVQNMFTAFGDVSKSIYCPGNCRSQRTEILPCCFQRMVEDPDMKEALEESILKYWNTIEFYLNFMDRPGGFDLSEWIDLNRMGEEGRVDGRAMFRIREMIPKDLKDAFYRMLHPNKYSCKKPVRCFD